MSNLREFHLLFPGAEASINGGFDRTKTTLDTAGPHSVRDTGAKSPRHTHTLRSSKSGWEPKNGQGRRASEEQHYQSLEDNCLSKGMLLH